MLQRIITVPRWYAATIEKTLELHVFGDASEDAFCAVAHSVVAEKAGEQLVRFIVGKTRVTPMKHHTKPKLELMAALTASRLKDPIIREHSIKLQIVFIWNDSTTVLQWLQNSDKSQPTFVANRVAEILDSSTVDEWRHILGGNNPADLGTRGLTIEELKLSAWLRGHEWLLQPVPEPQTKQEDITAIEPEETFLQTTNYGKTEQLIQWGRFSRSKGSGTRLGCFVLEKRLLATFC